VDELLIKYIAGSATEEERETALAWIRENTENRKYFEELKEYYHFTKIIQKPSGFNKEEGWNRVMAGYYKNQYQSQIQQKKDTRKKLMVRFVISSAAAVLIAFFIGFLANSFITDRKSSLTFNEIVVPLGAKSQVTLSDGTKVWLNAGSKLRYPVNFLKDTREVYLEGEAFFDVTKSHKRLFVVKTSKLNVKVYGTQFNVKSYPEENIIQTTLVRGSVAIETNDKSNKRTVFLKPNQSATYYKQLPVSKPTSEVSSPEETSAEALQKNVTPAVEKKKAEEPDKKIVVQPKVDPLPITSWKDKRWVIDGEDLGHLTVKLERRYNVKITFANESLKNYKFSGTLAEETFEQVLKIIQLSAPIKYSITSNNVVFSVDPLYKKKYDKMISKSNN